MTDHGKVTAKRIMALIQQQGFRCAMSGRELTPETASIDHCTPMSKGGKHLMSNIQILHRDINQAKSTMSMDEFVSMCREVVAVADSKKDQSCAVHKTTA